MCYRWSISLLWLGIHHPLSLLQRCQCCDNKAVTACDVCRDPFQRETHTMLHHRIPRKASLTARKDIDFLFFKNYL